MSKKVHPLGIRLGVFKTWTNNYYLVDVPQHLKKQLFVQNYIYSKLKKLGIKIVDVNLYQHAGKLQIQLGIYVSPSDINIYITNLLYKKYFKKLLCSNVTVTRRRSLAQRFVLKYGGLIKKFYFLVLILINIELEKKLTKILKQPVKITMKNTYFLNYSKGLRSVKRKLVKKMYYYRRNKKTFYKFVDVVNVATSLPSSYLFAQAIVSRMEVVKKHFGFFNLFKNTLNNMILVKPLLLGVKVEIAGKVNGKLRARKQVFQFGLQIPSQRFSAKIDYSFLEAHTYTGIFGIKVWFYTGDHERG